MQLPKMRSRLELDFAKLTIYASINLVLLELVQNDLFCNYIALNVYLLIAGLSTFCTGEPVYLTAYSTALKFFHCSTAGSA